ncbi:hypothetical protein M3Y98_00918000 [Aphelenchoides besseyi]|nr:hypothetical protein M3Y98_00918000 [Aphelenchoides besseyi]KAI6193463.1 hypothetical protein M3Y96_01020500 [Aphelenchoides besseyi]
MSRLCTIISAFFFVGMIFSVGHARDPLPPPNSTAYVCADDSFITITFYSVAGIAGVITLIAFVIVILGQIGHFRAQRQKKLKEAEDRAKGYTFTEGATEATEAGSTMGTVAASSMGTVASTVGSTLQPPTQNPGTGLPPSSNVLPVSSGPAPGTNATGNLSTAKPPGAP